MGSEPLSLVVGCELLLVAKGSTLISCLREMGSTNFAILLLMISNESCGAIR